ncbi:MAG: hypothetical protein KA383_03035 [Phycisphaerae bacterium]|nr:hypothetical protein [Phycisphaerae bacterium]
MQGVAVGWQERDYSDESYGEPVSTTGGLRRPPNGTLALMIIHGAAFVLMLMLRHGNGEAIVAMCALSGETAHPLGILLHPLATADVLRAAFVVLALWSLAGRLEPRMGLLRLVVLYVAGNLVAGGVYFAVARGLPTLATAPLDYPVGALAALCLTAWRQLRHDLVQLLGRVMSVATIYTICAGIVVVLAFADAREGALAWLLAAAAGAGSAPLAARWSSGPRRPRRVRQVVRPSIPPAIIQPPLDEPDVDDILAKISREGIGALTDAERDRLERARRAKLRRSH